MQLVAVHWMDSAHWEQEHSQAEAERLTPVALLTVGVLVSQTQDVLVLASEHCPDSGLWRRLTVIPRVVVQRVVTLVEEKQDDADARGV